MNCGLLVLLWWESSNKEIKEIKRREKHSGGVTVVIYFGDSATVPVSIHVVLGLKW